MFGELTILGFIALCTYFALRGGLLAFFSVAVYGDAEHLVHLFEDVHFLLFFVMLIFLAEAFSLDDDEEGGGGEAEEARGGDEGADGAPAAAPPPTCHALGAALPVGACGIEARRRAACRLRSDGGKRAGPPSTRVRRLEQGVQG